MRDGSDYLYAVPTLRTTEYHSLAEIAKRVPKDVVCLLAALRFHGLDTPAVRGTAGCDRGSTFHSRLAPGSARGPGTLTVAVCLPRMSVSM